ncbi:MAG: hypothetical protein D6759_08450 [Chloroflexi bacterium]|nr:MAG: hypothetical protein D6759_08450 [Chloroflexota bacterium]
MNSFYLLDKNVIRRAIGGLVKIGAERTISAEERESLVFVYQARQVGASLFMTPESFHVLQHIPGCPPEVDLILEAVQVIQPGRYVKRWARRLRKHSFTREDAKVLSLGTFGTDKVGSFLGVDTIVTLDLALINHYNGQFDLLQSRLEAMVAQLPEPYCYACLPNVMSPSQLLRFWH